MNHCRLCVVFGTFMKHRRIAGLAMEQDHSFSCCRSLFVGDRPHVVSPFLSDKPVLTNILESVKHWPVPCINKSRVVLRQTTAV
jgi:hypothetical protein